MKTKMVYGVKLMVLTELEASGDIKQDGKVVYLETPQEVTFDPDISEGQSTELRGGDGLVGMINEDDILTAFNATFRNALLDYGAMELLAGGNLITEVIGEGTEEEETIINGFEPLTLAEQLKTKRSPLKIEVYAAAYEQGSKHQTNIDGYAKVTLWNAIGRVPGWAHQDRAFSVPSYTVKSTDNAALGKPSFSIEDIPVEDLPEIPTA